MTRPGAVLYRAGMSSPLFSDRETDAWGRVVIKADAAFRLAHEGVDVWSLPIEPGEIIDQFNRHCREFDKLQHVIEAPPPIEHSPEEEHDRRSREWLIPPEAKALDVRVYLLDMCSTAEQRNRVNLEMDLYEARDLVPLLQLMIYLVGHFRAEKVVWGVGRGSSVASYCLFLIGVHRIDPIRYGLDIHEFLKP
jgi:DNA polymerase III alpha subunit